MFVRSSALAVALLPMAASAAMAQADDRYYGPHMWGGGWQMWLFGPLMMIVMIAMIAAVVTLVIRWSGGSGSHGAGGRSLDRNAHDILRERFARGEIDQEEYEARRRVLEN